MQKYFLHALTHRQVSISYETARQGGGTVQDLLNRLTKFAMRMVEPPGPYMQQKWFLVALRELLHHEVLSRGIRLNSAIWKTWSPLHRQWRMPCATTWAHGKLRDRVATMFPLRDPYQWGYSQQQHLGHNRTECMAKDHVEPRFNIPDTDEVVCAKIPWATPRDQSYQDN